MKPILSKPSKLDGVLSFDLPLTTCKERCMYYDLDICYSENNYHERFKPRINKLKRNLKLIRSDKFVKKLTYAIIRTKSLYFRFFSSGQVEDITQLVKVLKICSILKNVKFAIMCNSDIIYSQLIQSGYNIPKNANLLLSNYEPNKKTPDFMKNYLIQYNIGITQTTTKKSLTTCKASMKKDGLCETCTDCYDKKDITFKIHGKKAMRNIKK